MMYWDDLWMYGWWGLLGLVISMVLFWGVIIWLIVWIIRKTGQRDPDEDIAASHREDLTASHGDEDIADSHGEEDIADEDIAASHEDEDIAASHGEEDMHRDHRDQATSRAVGILKERYAKGEIGREQYQEMRKEIERDDDT
jgi:uncharacterized membrane protein